MILSEIVEQTSQVQVLAEEAGPRVFDDCDEKEYLQLENRWNNLPESDREEIVRSVAPQLKIATLNGEWLEDLFIPNARKCGRALTSAQCSKVIQILRQL